MRHALRSRQLKHIQIVPGVSGHTAQSMRLQVRDWIASAQELSAWVIEFGLTWADEVQVNFFYEQSISMTMLKAKLEESLNRQLGSLSIRLYQAGRMLHLETNALTRQSIGQLLKRAIPVLSDVAADPAAKLPPAKQLALFPKDLELLRMDTMAEVDLTNLLSAMERSALDTASEIESLGSSIDWDYGYVHVANSKGLNAGYASSHYALSCGVRTVETHHATAAQSGYAHSVWRASPTVSDALLIGVKAAQRAIDKKGSRSVATGSYRLLLAPRVVRRVLSFFAQAITGALVYEKTSFLYHQLGQPIFPEWLQIFEDPWMPSGLGSQPFDSDGVLTYPQVVVRDGAFHQYRLGQYSANRMNLQSTGHSGGSIYNWEISTADPSRIHTHESLMQILNDGIWITELFGENVEFTNGAFSIGFAGFLINKSQRTHAVSGVTLSGNLLELWSKLQYIGRDFEPGFSIRSGSWLIAEGVVAGD